MSDPNQSDYCREIESYLCRKNDGHLIRIVGPSFDLVSGWAVAGIPLAIAHLGIDRCFERYYRKGPRRRPVRIDFCEADVLDAFDEWRRALGVPMSSGEPAGSSHRAGAEEAGPSRSGASLPAQLARALRRLTDARATGRLGAEADGLIDRVGRELELARAVRGGVRGEARRAVAERLAGLDAELFEIAWRALDDHARRAVDSEAAAELASFRNTMPGERFAQVLEAAKRRKVRDRAGLPTLELR